MGLNDNLEGVQMTSTLPGFKNNRIFTGQETITGTVSGGVNQYSWLIPLGFTPDLVDVMFAGPVDNQFGQDNRPAGAWFKEGAIWSLGDNLPAFYDDYPVPWTMNARIEGTNLRIIATYVQTFTDGLTLAPTTFYYRLVDYSVF